MKLFAINNFESKIPNKSKILIHSIINTIFSKNIEKFIVSLLEVSKKLLLRNFCNPGITLALVQRPMAKTQCLAHLI